MAAQSRQPVSLVIINFCSFTALVNDFHAHPVIRTSPFLWHWAQQLSSPLISRWIVVRQTLSLGQPPSKHQEQVISFSQTQLMYLLFFFHLSYSHPRTLLQYVSDCFPLERANSCTQQSLQCSLLGSGSKKYVICLE